MLHAKFHGYWSTDSGKEVLKVLPYMGVVPHGSCDPDSLNIFLCLMATYEIWLR